MTNTLICVCVSDSPGCVCGFMSVERMRILLGLDTVGSLHNNQQRQQITPDIKFTCDGLITKWIVVATWRYSNNFYPELQVWRKVESNAYHKINGTFIIIEKENINRIYEYEDFSPIPVQTGDILGIFIPRSDLSRLRVVSERDYGPTNYYIRTSENAAESPYDTIDIDNTPSLLSFGYNVLVTVEISELCAVQLQQCYIMCSISNLLGAMDQPSSSTPLSKPSKCTKACIQCC